MFRWVRSHQGIQPQSYMQEKEVSYERGNEQHCENVLAANWKQHDIVGSLPFELVIQVVESTYLDATGIVCSQRACTTTTAPLSMFQCCSL